MPRARSGARMTVGGFEGPATSSETMQSPEEDSQYSFKHATDCLTLTHRP